MAEKLPLRWVEHLRDEKDREGFFQSLVNNRFVLGRLKTILLEERDRLDRSDGSDYDSPSWAFKQADTIGQRKQLQKVLDLLSFI